MQIAPQRQPYQPQTSFKGFRSKDSRALLAFDLDGTLLEGTNEDIQRILYLKEKANAVLSYASGQTIQEFLKKQEKYAQEGFFIPTPEHFTANNGQFVYDNIDGKLVEDMNWRKIIKEKTNFDRETVISTMQEIGQRPKYKHSLREITRLENFNDPKLKGIGLRRQEDPHFWNSKISYYEWNPSIHMVEYFVGHDVHLPKLKDDITEALERKDIKNKFIYHEYDKKIMDKCPDSMLRQSRPLREDVNGKMRVLFVCPADKADGVQYLGQKLNISTDEILSAGNDSNDYSLADLSKKGAFFVCVGNAFNNLVNHAQKVSSDAIIFAKNHGAAGITEGIETVLAKFRPDLN